jgi:hypothetical protein
MKAIQLNQEQPDQEWADYVWDQIKSLEYGAVAITVRDARVIQIEKTERLRFEKSGALQTREASKAGGSPGAPVNHLQLK